MSKHYMFAESDGKAHEVKVDPAHMDRQKRDLESAGYPVTILDEDERIKYGLLAQRLNKAGL